MVKMVKKNVDGIKKKKKLERKSPQVDEEMSWGYQE